VRLQHLIARHAEPAAGVERLAEACGGVVRAADCPDLAGLDQPRESLERFIKRRRPVVAMRLIEVDIIGA
jgi:hypothetical protein